MNMRFGHPVQEATPARVRALAEARRRRLEAIRTPERARRYGRAVRARIADCFGPFPERAPWGTRATGTMQKKGFRIEKIVFASRPGFPVTAHLDVPDGLSAPKSSRIASRWDALANDKWGLLGSRKTRVRKPCFAGGALGSTLTAPFSFRHNAIFSELQTS